MSLSFQTNSNGVLWIAPAMKNSLPVQTTPKEQAIPYKIRYNYAKVQAQGSRFWIITVGENLKSKVRLLYAQ